MRFVVNRLECRNGQSVGVSVVLQLTLFAVNKPDKSRAPFVQFRPQVCRTRARKGLQVSHADNQMS